MKNMNLKKIVVMCFVVGVFVFNLNLLQAKGSEDQDQIILLNDSAAALEDSNPELSKNLTLFADEKEKQWEADNANKDPLPTPIIDKNIALLQEHINLLKASALAIAPNYPMIAKSLTKMAQDINRTIENGR